MKNISALIFSLLLVLGSNFQVFGVNEVQFSILSTYTQETYQIDVSSPLNPFSSWRTEHENTIVRSTNDLCDTFFNNYFFESAWHSEPDHLISVSDYNLAHPMDPYNFIMEQRYSVQVFGPITPGPGKQANTLTNFHSLDVRLFQFPLEISRKIENGSDSRLIRESTGTILLVNTDQVLPHRYRLVFYHDGLMNGEIIKKIEPSEALVYTPTVADVSKALGFKITRAVLFHKQQLD